MAGIQERLPRHQTRRRRRRRKWRKVYYALRRTEALSDTPIRPSVCPSPGRAAALGYRYAGCLQLSHVRSADMSAEGRIDPPRVELSSAEGISCCRPGAITCFIGVVRTAAERPSYTSTALLQRNVLQNVQLFRPFPPSPALQPIRSSVINISRQQAR